jgi:hypothetical protein
MNKVNETQYNFFLKYWLILFYLIRSPLHHMRQFFSQHHEGGVGALIYFRL